MIETQPIISVRGLRTQFGAQVIHDNLDLDVRAGEVLGVVGGSGTGKSVLLRTIIGLNKQRAGSISVFVFSRIARTLSVPVDGSTSGAT